MPSFALLSICPFVCLSIRPFIRLLLSWTSGLLASFLPNVVECIPINGSHGGYGHTRETPHVQSDLRTCLQYFSIQLERSAGELPTSLMRESRSNTVLRNVTGLIRYRVFLGSFRLPASSTSAVHWLRLWLACVTGQRGSQSTQARRPPASEGKKRLQPNLIVRLPVC